MKVIVRSKAAGCFYGDMISLKNNVVTLHNARRLWYWDGAATLSELAVKGTSRPEKCKFPVSVPQVVIIGVCEVISCTTKAVQSIEAVPVWSAH